MKILSMIFLILLNGIFAMSEIALLTARKNRLQKLAEEGKSSAAVAVLLGEDPTTFLSTIQVGITSIGILNGIIGQSVFAGPVSGWLLRLGLAPQTAALVATITVVVMVTYVSIVVGELVPKRIGQISPELIACSVAKPIRLLSILSRPFVWLLSSSTSGLVRILGIGRDGKDSVTEDEIQAILKEGSETGVIEEQQHTMFRNIFQLDDRLAGSLMVPRSDVVFLDTSLPMDDNLKRVAESEHTRFPVCEGGLDRLVGFVRGNQLMAEVLKGRIPDWESCLQPCAFVPETLTGLELLEQFQEGAIEIAFVIDEYGEFQGIVTLHDLLEAVTGEFRQVNPEDSWAIRREDGSWLLDGSIPIPEMMERLELPRVPELERGHYNTLAGMVMLLLERLPREGDHVTWEGWRFEVVDMDANRIDKVMASPLLPIE